MLLSDTEVHLNRNDDSAFDRDAQLTEERAVMLNSPLNVAAHIATYSLTIILLSDRRKAMQLFRI